MNDNQQQTLKATIFEVQRLSTEDGPGIRTTVFFKGCGLQCAWCHNPESISPKPQMHWIANRCIGCKTCLKVCPENALAFTAAGNRIDRKLCTGCGLCGEECPAGALELIGKQWTLQDLTAEVLKDRSYFEKSGGGITLGGGEPILQATFCRDFLKRLIPRWTPAACALKIRWPNFCHLRICCSMTSKRSIQKGIATLRAVPTKRSWRILAMWGNACNPEGIPRNFGSGLRSSRKQPRLKKISMESAGLWPPTLTAWLAAGICVLLTICAGTSTCD